MTTSQEKKWGNITPMETPEGTDIGIAKCFDLTPMYPRGCRSIEEFSNPIFAENLYGKNDSPLTEELLELSKFRDLDEKQQR